METFSKIPNYPPGLVWEKFFQLSQIPRPSGQEAAVRNWILSIAQHHRYRTQVDQKGNLVVCVPASSGREHDGPVIIQAHLDMVCDALAGQTFDFKTQPLSLQVEDGRVQTTGTTLGADNGIGVSMALALMDLAPDSFSHPPLELLFTVEEETGLFGAKALDGSMLTGKKLINLDTEEWGSLYIGCAGGEDCQLTGSVSMDSIPPSWKIWQIQLQGLAGGHSGIDIHRYRGNAIKLLAQSGHQAAKDLDLRLINFQAGRAHNIIPPAAQMLVALDPECQERFFSLLQLHLQNAKITLPPEDQQLSWHWTLVASDPTWVALEQGSTRDFFGFLCLFPHGPTGFNWQMSEPLASSSSNLAKVILDQQGRLFIQTSLRFFRREAIAPLKQQIIILAQQLGLTVNFGDGYASWPPQIEGNSLLEIARHVYQRLTGDAPRLKAIHAGLECGVLGEKIPGLAMVSFGPNIQNAHTPRENVEINSTNRTWELLLAILATKLD